MKAEELRIGNWLKMHDKEYIFELSDFHSLQENVIEYGNLDLYPWKPIPLTEEWLIKFGFELIIDSHDEYGFTDKGNGFRLELSEYYIKDGRAVFYYNLPSNNSHTCISYCKYVHQLQNLYYSLTGTELTVK